MTTTSAQVEARRAVVVDDEVALARLVAGYLERDGFEVSVSHDGARAVELLRAVDPDVVVLDLGLPGIDGIEVCRQLRTFSDCYVVMLTARAEEVDTLIGLSVGADDYITNLSVRVSSWLGSRSCFAVRVVQPRSPHRRPHHR